jgi:hypothetical protein
MAAEAQFPAVSKGLLDELERMFPNKIPVEPLTERQFAVLQGQQEVIRKLRREYDRQQNNILKPIVSNG